MITVILRAKQDECEVIENQSIGNEGFTELFANARIEARACGALNFVSAERRKYLDGLSKTIRILVDKSVRWSQDVVLANALVVLTDWSIALGILMRPSDIYDEAYVLSNER